MCVDKSKKKKQSKAAGGEEEETEKKNPMLEQKKKQFPGLCIADDPHQVKLLANDIHVAQEAMNEVRVYLRQAVHFQPVLVYICLQHFAACILECSIETTCNFVSLCMEEHCISSNLYLLVDLCLQLEALLQPGAGKEDKERRKEEPDRGRRDDQRGRERRSRSHSRERHSKRSKWDEQDRGHYRRSQSRSRSRSPSPHRSSSRWDKSYQHKRPSAPVVSEVMT